MGAGLPVDYEYLIRQQAVSFRYCLFLMAYLVVGNIMESLVATLCFRTYSYQSLQIYYKSSMII